MTRRSSARSLESYRAASLGSEGTPGRAGAPLPTPSRGPRLITHSDASSYFGRPNWMHRYRDGEGYELVCCGAVLEPGPNSGGYVRVGSFVRGMRERQSLPRRLAGAWPTRDPSLWDRIGRVHGGHKQAATDGHDGTVIDPGNAMPARLCERSPANGALGQSFACPQHPARRWLHPASLAIGLESRSVAPEGTSASDRLTHHATPTVNLRQRSTRA